MCGRITLLTYDELSEVLEAVEARMGMRVGHCGDRAQARPGNALQAILPSPDDTQKLKIAALNWGFMLPNSKKLIFNTRIESALEGSRLWAGPIRDGRCVLPVASFFEPHGSETVRSPRTGRQMKRQYEFASPAGEPLLLASVQREGCLSVVTTAPNASVSPIHERMPLALRFEEVTTWLGNEFAMLADRSGLDLVATPEDHGEQLSAQLALF